MTWANHGAVTINGFRVWNIGHIVTIKFEALPGTLPTLDEVAARLHWANSQAMWVDENTAKGPRVVGRVAAAQPPLIQVEAPPPLPPLPPQHMIDELIRVWNTG